MMNRVAIMDPSLLFREAINKILSESALLTVVSDYSSISELKWQLDDDKPDMVITEFERSNPRYFRDIEVLLNKNPHLKIIILTSDDRTDYIKEALLLGVTGILHKRMELKEIVRAIELIPFGSMYLYPKALSFVIDEVNRLSYGVLDTDSSFVQSNVIMPFHLLTKRECETLQLLAEGKSNIAIAKHLSISDKTVKNHVSSILMKMKVSDRTNAVITAIKNGWVHLQNGKPL